MGLNTTRKRSNFYAVEDFLADSMPRQELLNFKQWYAKARTKHGDTPFFYRPGDKVGKALLHTILMWIYGCQRPQGETDGTVPTSSRPSCC